MMKYIQKTYVLLSFLSMSLLVFCFCSPMQFGDDDEKEKDIIKNVRRTLTYYHYSPQNINDEFSEKVYRHYMESLDPYKTYFKQEDINLFSKSSKKLDDYFKEEDLTFYNQTIDTLYKRMSEIEELTKTSLEKPLNYSAKSKIYFDYDKASYAQTQSEWKKKWIDRLKYSILQDIIIWEKSAKDSAEWAKKDSIGLDKDEFDPRGKSFAELEKEARKNVGEDMEEYFRRFQKRKKSEWFSLYVNAYTEEFDPHTTYFSPKDNENFELSMSGQLEGIGATLADEKGYPTIKSLVIGGPAWKQGELEVEDKITKVAQGNDEPVNVIGMLLDDAIRLIRGKKGTVVTLTVKKKSGAFKEIKIKRDIVELEETFAKSAIIKDEKGDNYGLIYLPSFYLNYDKKGHDASDDVAREINELKKSNIKGLIFDLRGNGGGDLSECVEIIGHFIDRGPVVQVVQSDGYQKVYNDKIGGVIWDGPMAVMVNELSASASEIMAAALQDYKRAVIIGSPKTYGKGTVQTISPLNRYMVNSDEYGMLKFTIQKFYRINGGSTQLKGVASDIVLPDRYSYMDISEGSNKSALAWDQIKPLNYITWNQALDVNSLAQKSKERTNNNPQIKLIDEYAHYLKTLEDDKSASLDYDSFKKDFEDKESMSKKFENLSKYKTKLKLNSPDYEIPLMEKDSVLSERRKKWHEGLEKDVYLEETMNVLKDMNAA